LNIVDRGPLAEGLLTATAPRRKPVRMPKRVTPNEAAELLTQGFTYVDVRSVPEYEQGHPKGAVNVPFMHFQAGRMVPNGEFLDVMKRVYTPDSQLVIGCKTGGRSLAAATQLEQSGFTQLVEMKCGFDGSPDGPGWSKVGLPVESVTAGGAYEEIKRK
jgi:rhodanese-related sulfurtransferase